MKFHFYQFNQQHCFLILTYLSLLYVEFTSVFALTVCVRVVRGIAQRRTVQVSALWREELTSTHLMGNSTPSMETVLTSLPRQNTSSTLRDHRTGDRQTSSHQSHIQMCLCCFNLTVFQIFQHYFNLCVVHMCFRIMQTTSVCRLT